MIIYNWLSADSNDIQQFCKLLVYLMFSIRDVPLRKCLYFITFLTDPMTSCLRSALGKRRYKKSSSPFDESRNENERIRQKKK